jgi:hypothetical protein
LGSADDAERAMNASTMGAATVGNAGDGGSAAAIDVIGNDVDVDDALAVADDAGGDIDVDVGGTGVASSVVTAGAPTGTSVGGVGGSARVDAGGGGATVVVVVVARGGGG